MLIRESEVNSLLSPCNIHPLYRWPALVTTSIDAFPRVATIFNVLVVISEVITDGEGVGDSDATGLSLGDGDSLVKVATGDGVEFCDVFDTTIWITAAVAKIATEKSESVLYETFFLSEGGVVTLFSTKSA